MIWLPYRKHTLMHHDLMVIEDGGTRVLHVAFTMAIPAPAEGRRTRPDEAPSTMTNTLVLGVLTDTHLAPAGSPPRGFINPYPFDQSFAMLDTALDWFRERDVDAIAILGDLVMFEDEASLDAGMTRIAALGTPVLIVPGNHDGVDWEGAIARNLPNQETPAWPTISRALDVKVEQNPERWWTGGVSLPEDGPAVVLSHFPILSVGDFLIAAGFPYAGDATWDGSTEGLAERTLPVVAISGHVHIRYEVVEGAVLQLGFGALIEPPHSAAILTLGEQDGAFAAAVEHISVAEHQVERLPVISEAQSTWRFVDGVWARQ